MSVCLFASQRMCFFVLCVGVCFVLGKCSRHMAEERKNEKGHEKGHIVLNSTYYSIFYVCVFLYMSLVLTLFFFCYILVFIVDHWGLRGNH